MKVGADVARVGSNGVIGLLRTDTSGTTVTWPDIEWGYRAPMSMTWTESVTKGQEMRRTTPT